MLLSKVPALLPQVLLSEQGCQCHPIVPIVCRFEWISNFSCSKVGICQDPCLTAKLRAIEVEDCDGILRMPCSVSLSDENQDSARFFQRLDEFRLHDAGTTPCSWLCSMCWTSGFFASLVKPWNHKPRHVSRVLWPIFLILLAEIKLDLSDA